MKRLAFSMILVVFGVVRITGVGASPIQGDRERLEASIRSEITPLITVWDNVTFKVDPDRTVTLSGQVRDPLVKSHAEQDTKRIQGVGRVDNRIEVLPLSPADDRLRVALYRAIYGQIGLDRYSFQLNPPIHIIVKNGNATLEGVVADKGEYTRADIAAKEVSGVFSVTNRLRVER